MSKLDQQFLEFRELRNAAKKNVMADVELLKSGWKERGLGKRIVGRVGGGAQDVFEKASETAEDNRGVLGALVGAVVLWFASGALLELLSDSSDEVAPSDDPGTDAINPEDSEPVAEDGNELQRPAETLAPGDDHE